MVGFKSYKASEIKKKSKQIETETRYLIKNAPYVSTFNTNSRTEFLAIDTDTDRHMRTEVKWQSAAGSVDEKFTYLMDNAVNAFPEKEVNLIIDGGGYKKGAREWVQRAIDNNWQNYKEKGKTIRLFTISEFKVWMIKEFGNKKATNAA